MKHKLNQRLYKPLSEQWAMIPVADISLSLTQSSVPLTLRPTQQHQHHVASLPLLVCVWHWEDKNERDIILDIKELKSNRKKHYIALFKLLVE